MTELEHENVGILKSIWRKNEQGIYSGYDLKGITLKPRAGFSKTYFKIENEIALLTNNPGPVWDNLFSTFGTTEFLMRQSIVPVVAWNDGDAEIKCIGTGFFISASGLLLTAAHVIRDPIDENYVRAEKVGEDTFKLSEGLHLGVMLPANPAMKNAPFDVRPELREAKWFVHPFEWTQHWGREQPTPLFDRAPEFKLDVDIAVCKVRESILGGCYQPLNIGPHNLRVGDRAVAIGYAKMRNIKFGGDDYQPELMVSVGSVVGLHANEEANKTSPTPGPCFDFDAKIPGKMSGSPILVGSGIITKGVVSRSWHGVDHATGSLIAPVLGLNVVSGMSLADLMQHGNEGIAIVQGLGL